MLLWLLKYTVKVLYLVYKIYCLFFAFFTHCVTLFFLFLLFNLFAFSYCCLYLIMCYYYPLCFGLHLADFKASDSILSITLDAFQETTQGTGD